MITEIKNNDLGNAKTDAVAVLDFNATWCGPCQMLKPVLEELSTEMAGVSFYGIDTDENSALAQQFGIMNIPAVVVLKNGVQADMNVGFVPKPQLQAFIEKNM